MHIWNRAGRRPVLAANNSNGDIEMLEFTRHPDKPSLRLLVLHDDAERGFAYVNGSERALERAARGWLDGRVHEGRLGHGVLTSGRDVVGRSLRRPSDVDASRVEIASRVSRLRRTTARPGKIITDSTPAPTRAAAFSGQHVASAQTYLRQGREEAGRLPSAASAASADSGRGRGGRGTSPRQPPHGQEQSEEDNESKRRLRDRREIEVHPRCHEEDRDEEPVPDRVELGLSEWTSPGAHLLRMTPARNAPSTTSRPNSALPPRAARTAGPR